MFWKEVDEVKGKTVDSWSRKKRARMLEMREKDV